MKINLTKKQKQQPSFLAMIATWLRLLLNDTDLKKTL